ncbi:transmembrane protein [Loa loa]|uniref:Transmembrane protein n=1 Tax=Loa loa TaxID=7209 RepID=A0A1S0UIX2_LOALO|nr:transmembrane protein [Loa loa]EJD75483.1 transmembrane protein [Loa loa]
MIIRKCLVLTLLLQLDCTIRRCWATAEATFDFSIELPFMATAFVQTGDELHYFSDIGYHDSLASGAPLKSDDQNGVMLNNQLQFTPSELQFDEQSVGMAKQQEVRVHNPTASTVRFDAISGSTVHFHCSFPEHKTVNPGESTTFSVVFLPRQEGLIENVLIVHSSLGSFTYSVKGKGKGSPYRIRPLVGAKIPVNGTLVSPVQLHNPHPTTLRVTEVYTSDVDLHLELPDVAPETQYPVSLWDIAPYETKTVMNAKLLGARERNSSAYIKIKTNRKRHKVIDERLSEDSVQTNLGLEHVVDTLIVPVEVEITKKRGLYATVDLLDFGLIRSGDKSSVLMLEVVSTLERGIEIENLYVESNEKLNGIYMEFASKPPISVKCGARQQPGASKAIAKIIFDTKLLRINEEGPKLVHYKGRIVAESRGGTCNVTIPYTAQVYYGSIKPKVEETAFHNLLKPPVSRSISLTNDLPFGVAVWKITLNAEAQRFFKAKLISNVVMIAAGETKSAIYLQYVRKERDGFAAFFNAHTNVTTFQIPLVIFSGKLKVVLHSLHQKEFNFGLIDAGDSRSIQFSITNENPVAIIIKNLKRALPSITTLSLLTVQAEQSSILNLTNLKKSDFSGSYREGEDFPLPGSSSAVFRYTLRAPNDRAVLHDKFVIETDFEYSSFPVTYAVGQGTIVAVPEELVFPDTFPGRISSHSLKVFSTFEEDMRVLRISSLFNDRKVFFEAAIRGSTPVIRTKALSDLGRVHVIPSISCTDDCYVGMPLHTADGQWFTYGMKLPQNLAEIDYYLYSRLRRRFHALQAEGKHCMNGTIIIDTDKVKHLEVPLASELIWPRLLTRSTVHFPLTAVGNFTIVNLTLTNPSSLPIAVQLLPLVVYPDADTLIDFFRNELDSPLTDPIEMNETLMFSLRDTELFTLKPDSPVPKLREQLESVLGIPIPKFTLSMLLQPRMKVRVRVGFLPSDYVLRSSLLLIRNNLTVLEPVVLYGRGARMDMQVEGRAARTRDPLTFEIQPHHLSDCHNPKRLTHKLFTTLTVKRSFTIMNTGEVVFTVVNISINNVPCENRGFRILNCQPFRLEPNETHILDVAYTPDFLISWNEAALQFYMHMNGTSWLFPMGASVPRHMLAKCHAALPRPPFECFMYYSCLSVLLFCLICIVACAYLEGDRTITCGIRQQFGQIRRVLDPNTTDMRRTRDKGLCSLSKFKPSAPRRHVLHYSEDSNLLIRSFWQAANSVLWLFSFVWQFRGDDTRVTVKQVRTRQKKTLIKCHGDSTFSTKGASLNSGKSASTPSDSSNITAGGGSSAVEKRYGYKSLSSYSIGHASHSINSQKNVSVNGVCRSSKEKVSAERTSFLKTRETKENRAGSSRLRSRAVLEAATVSCPSGSSDSHVKNTDLVKDESPISRDTKKPEHNYISHNVAVLQTTEESKSSYNWLSMHREKSVDERSEAGLSDASAPPEWVDGPAIINGNALADATERLFLSEKKLSAQQCSVGPSLPSSVTVVHPTRLEQRMDPQRKQEVFSGHVFYLEFKFYRKISGPIGSQRNNGKKGGNRPSAFIEQLQRERKLAEDQYLRNKWVIEEKDEVWPGFNLRLPTLAEYFCDHDHDKQGNSESVWQMPPISTSNNWSQATTNDFVQQLPTSDGACNCLAESVRAFRLNPEAPPFIIENSSNSRPRRPRPTNLAAEPVFPSPHQLPSPRQTRFDHVHRVHHHNTFIDDPLGLSGSLFGRGSANIWASDPRSTSGVVSRDNRSELDPNSGAVYWTEMTLADEEREKCP